MKVKKALEELGVYIENFEINIQEDNFNELGERHESINNEVE